MSQDDVVEVLAEFLSRYPREAFLVVKGLRMLLQTLCRQRDRRLHVELKKRGQKPVPMKVMPKKRRQQGRKKCEVPEQMTLFPK